MHVPMSVVSRVLIAVVLLSACVPTSLNRHPTTMAPSERGEDVALHLNERYADSTTRCYGGSPTAPAFLCSGILLRAAKYSDNYHSWIPNPETAAYGVAFSWVRHDADMWATHPTASGFIVYPRQYSDPIGLNPLSVRCVFVHDAWTAGPDRCTWHQNQSGQFSWIALCQDLVPPVLTGEAWVARLSPRARAAAATPEQPTRPSFDDDENQCAFAVDSRRDQTAAAWMAFIRARELLHTRHRNEVIVDDWTAADEKRMPVEAFYYGTIKADPDEADPLTEAQKNQVLFLQVTDRWVPVIRWQMNRQGQQYFFFRPEDQAIAR